MALLVADRVGMHFGGPVLFEDVSLEIHPGDRIGLVGRNGSGKSTLLEVLAGERTPVTGSVRVPRGIRIARQAQEMAVRPGETLLQAMHAALGDARALETRLREIETALADAEDAEARQRLLEAYTVLQERQAESGLYDWERRVETLLTGLGLHEGVWHRPLSGFSGGERNVIALARALLKDPDVLLLDEPTNHLDLEAVEWFVRLLRGSKMAVVLVSHDRHLLDVAVREIWELSSSAVRRWSGGYSDWQRQREEERARQERAYKVAQRNAERLRFQARRLMDMANAYDDASQAKRAQEMQRRAEVLEAVERPESDAGAFRAQLTAGQRHGRIAVQLRDVRLVRGERVLLEDVNCEIEEGQRVALVGPNGSGKTSLLRLILDEGRYDHPSVRLGRSVRIGEYRQLHDVLDAEASLVDWTADVTRLTTKDAGLLLHRFLFTREDLDRRIGTLSGGEKSRLQLARLVAAGSNLIVLDEPTNHLDIPSAEQLEEMLLEFEGTLILASHDRWLLERLSTRVLEVRDGRLLDHPVDFPTWWKERRAESGTRRGALEIRGREARDKETARLAHETRLAARRERQRWVAKTNRLESEVAALELELPTLEARLETAYAPDAEQGLAGRLLERLAHVRTRLEAALGEWEEAAARVQDAATDPATDAEAADRV